MLREVFSARRGRAVPGAPDRRRGHAEPCPRRAIFSAAHAAKDSGIALSLAREHGLTLPLAAATKSQYDRMIEKGLGELDKSGVAELTFPGRG